MNNQGNESARSEKPVIKMPAINVIGDSGADTAIGRKRDAGKVIDLKVKTLEQFTTDLVRRSNSAHAIDAVIDRNDREEFVDFSNDPTALAGEVSIRKIEKTGDTKKDKQISVLNKFGISAEEFGVLINHGSWLQLDSSYTTQAVKELQRLAGLKKNQCDGLLGPQTIVALEIYANSLEYNGTEKDVFGSVTAAKRISSMHRIYNKVYPTMTNDKAEIANS